MHLNAKVIGVETQRLARELFLLLPRGHCAILCTSNTFPHITLRCTGAGVVSIIRFGLTRRNGGHYTSIEK